MSFVMLPSQIKISIVTVVMSNDYIHFGEMPALHGVPNQ